MCGVYEEYYWVGYDTSFLLRAASCGLGMILVSYYMHAASCVEFMRNIIGLGMILVSYYMQHHVWSLQGILLVWV